MSKTIQIRNVPDQLRHKLKVRAAEQGLSLSNYIVAQLTHLAGTISPQELAERARTIVRENLTPSPADLIRADRDRR